jgi:hypothetical protein
MNAVRWWQIKWWQAVDVQAGIKLRERPVVTAAAAICSWVNR